MNRDTIMTALQTKLETLKPDTVKVVERPKNADKFLDPPKVPSIQIEGDKESVETVRGLPSKRTLMVNLWLHADVRPNQSPGKRLDDLIGAIETALAPDAAKGVQTLGGTVSHCWIEGDIERFEYQITDQVMAIIPVRILVP